MDLLSLASAFPRHVFTQRECWDLLVSADGLRHVRPRSRELLEKILLGDSGILTRHFACGDLAEVFACDAGGLHRLYAGAAPKLAAEALGKACRGAGVKASDLDALFICSCTGYLCPGLTSYVAEEMALRPEIFLQDLLGLGCGAALPMLEAARCFVAAHPGARVATVAVEVCSAAFFLDDDPGVLISLCLFGDGAAAAVWGDDEAAGSHRLQNFRTVHQPEHREKIRFVNAGGKLKNQLHRSVPGLAAKAVSGLFDLRTGEPDQVISHTGGRDVIEQIEAALPAGPLAATRSVLRDFGNVSSPCVLMALERALAGPEAGDRLWLTAFGAGFAAHACELVRPTASCSPAVDHGRRRA